jgi:hypothetical protein
LESTRSRPKAAARLDLEVSAGWVSPSSHSLWGDDALRLSTRRCWKPNPGHLPALCPRKPPTNPHRRPSRPVCTASLCVVSRPTLPGRTAAALQRLVCTQLLHHAHAVCLSAMSGAYLAERGRPNNKLVRQCLRRFALPCTACLPSCLRCVAVRSILGRDQLIECSPR